MTLRVGVDVGGTFTDGAKTRVALAAGDVLRIETPGGGGFGAPPGQG